MNRVLPRSVGCDGDPQRDRNAGLQGKDRRMGSRGDRERDIAAAERELAAAERELAISGPDDAWSLHERAAIAHEQSARLHDSLADLYDYQDQRRGEAAS